MTVTAAATAEGGAAAAAVAEWDQGSDSSAHGNARVGTASVVGASLGACVASRVCRVVGPNSVLSWCAGRVRSDVTRFAASRGIAGRVRSRRPVAVPKDPTGPRRARRVRTVFYSLGELMYIPIICHYFRSAARVIYSIRCICGRRRENRGATGD